MDETDDLPKDDLPNDEQYHLDVSEGDVAANVLLPGNPERVEKITEGWDWAEDVAAHREYRTVTGEYGGTPISVTSTGIGSPSAAIAVEELARVGAKNLLRVGSCGAIQSHVDVGDLVISAGAVRQEGTTDEYVREDYPAVADDLVVSALVAAAERLGHTYHVGITASTDSFYTGQERPGYGGYLARGSDERVAELQAANVLNFEMETSAILTLGTLYGLRAGSVCTVFSSRTTGEFRVAGERRAARTANEAMSILAEMDARAAAAGVERWYPDLGIAGER